MKLKNLYEPVQSVREQLDSWFKLVVTTEYAPSWIGHYLGARITTRLFARTWGLEWVAIIIFAIYIALEAIDAAYHRKKGDFDWRDYIGDIAFALLGIVDGLTGI